MMLDSLFERYDCLLILDTETSGLSFTKDQIIELAAVKLVKNDGEIVIVDQMDEFIRLPEGQRLDPKIVELTHITDEMLCTQGLTEGEALGRFVKMFAGERALVIAYNAHFDLSFLYYSLARYGLAAALCGIGMLDALTIYKDRRDYPHKLENAIEQYHLQDKVVNSHRAIDDTLALKEVLIAMEGELPDLHRYLNLFGYNPKFGVEGARISSVTYKPQPYHDPTKLYNK
jgi:DNA polymerase-3 subunit epsilon